MISRAWCGLWSAIATLLFVPAFGANAVPEISRECEDWKRHAMEEHVSDVTIELIDPPQENWKIDDREVVIKFAHIGFNEAIAGEDMLERDCTQAEWDGSFPAYSGFAWVVLMPHKTTFSLVGPSRLDTTIRSYLEEEIDNDLNTRSLRMLVSGPFWKLSRRGEIPIGAVVRNREVVQEFRGNFSAKYVLCAGTDGRVDLMDGEVGMFEGLASSTKERLRKNKEKLCAAAIQVGPALFEKSDTPDADLGIGANSRNRSRRNILIKVGADEPGGRSEGRLILWSTLFDIAPYDAMVASEALVGEALGRDGSGVGKIVWAVGLVDDESLSGPVFAKGGRPILELTEVGRPTGAIMQFVLDGGKGER